MRLSSAFFASLATRAAFAGLPSTPSQTGIKSVDVGMTVVGGVQGAVGAEGNAVVYFVQADLIPLAKTSLGTMASQVESINTTLTPYAVGVVQPLAESQLANVPVFLNMAQALVANIQDVGTQLTTNFSQQTQQAVAAELSFVLSAVQPAVNPVMTLAKGWAGTSTSETGQQIANGVNKLNYAAGAGMDPLRVAVSKLV